MIKNLDDKHRRILWLLKKNNSRKTLSYRKIWDELWFHHQTIINKILQLEEMWYIRKDYVNEKYEILEDPVLDIVNIPVYWTAQCWNSINYNITENPIEYIPYSTKLLWITNINDYFFIRAKWKSMEPEIQQGDILLIKKQQTYNVNDKVLVIHNETVKVKKIITTGWKNYLVSINLNHSNLELVPDENIQIIGIVKKIVKNY